MLIFQCVWFHIGKRLCFPLFGAATKAIGNYQKALRKPRGVFELSFVAGTLKEKGFVSKKNTFKKKNIFGIYGCFSKIGVYTPKKSSIKK